MQHTCMNPMTFASHPGLLPQNADSSDIVGHHGPRPSPSSLNLSLLHASVHVIHTAKPLYVFAAAAARVFVVLALAVIVHSQGSWWMHGQCMFRKTKKRVCTVLRETHTCIIHACMNPMMFASHPVTQASCRKLRTRRTSSDIMVRDPALAVLICPCFMRVCTSYMPPNLCTYSQQQQQQQHMSL